MPKFVLDDEGDDLVEVVIVKGDEPYRFVSDISARQFAEQVKREEEALSKDLMEQTEACAEFLRKVVFVEDRKRLSEALNGKGPRPIGYRRLLRLYSYLVGVYAGKAQGGNEQPAPEPQPSGSESTPTTQKVVSFSKGTVEVSDS